mgnify:CR=1 FL=1
MLPLTLVLALGPNGELGLKGGLPWPKIPDDMRRFREITMGRPVIMGRVTWEGLPEKFRPLPGRTNIVVTRNRNWTPGPSCPAMIAYTLEAAITAARQEHEDPCVIGGAELYKQAWPLATRVFLTEVQGESFEADTFLRTQDLETARFRLTELAWLSAVVNTHPGARFLQLDRI